MLTAIAWRARRCVAPAAVAPLAPEAVHRRRCPRRAAIVIGGKITLGRSFGLMPANRGVVCTGLYRVVRHPIYMGYLVTHVAFLAANPSLWNIVALVDRRRSRCWRAPSARKARWRAIPPIVAYQSRVRWRVLPGLF